MCFAAKSGKFAGNVPLSDTDPKTSAHSEQVSVAANGIHTHSSKVFLLHVKQLLAMEKPHLQENNCDEVNLNDVISIECYIVRCVQQ